MCAMSVGQAKIMKKKLVHCIQRMADVVVEELSVDNGELITMEYLAASTLVRRLMTVHALSICTRYEADKNPRPRPEVVAYLTMFLFQEMGPYYDGNIDRMPLTDGRGVLPCDFHKHIMTLVQSMVCINKDSQTLVIDEVVKAMNKRLTEEVVIDVTSRMSRVFGSFL